ncbi:Uncharacterized protein PECH_005459 [Penicillium ucsense]|uniref:Uncharacterized protein n=1 Tax=Penicillium ucsense TaxID=2839758 RepID=A0A8J8W5W9_9EURO|nr:Uncharacterized protein PECM_004189 [Penicillium ucsense]KAF7736356.1 Uncharacterized protein PECH_005459 [Penicillium ucsense]
MNVRFIITASAVVTGGSAIYLYMLHRKLASRIEHRSHRGKLSSKSMRPTVIDSVAEDIFTDQNVALHDHSSKQVSRVALPKGISPGQLLTKLARRNMIAFSHLPQTWVMRLLSMAPEEQQSFKSAHIDSLNFDKGDLVCGMYRVIECSGNKVEFDIQMRNIDYVHGRLALGYKETTSGIVFSSETFMWRRSDEIRLMPLEKPLLHWMHETAAWWLLDSGTRYLMELDS